MARSIVIIAALLGALSVGLGAFGAHGLKQIVTETQVATFETGVKYQMYHAFFLLFIGICPYLSEKAKKVVLYLVLSGVLFFSGSIYLLTFKDLIDVNLKIIGPITPVGGLMLIAAWVYTAIQMIKNRALIK
ncbi:DUF423 domain-containing protein [Myroides indicus]|jgi:uncharacterized membrane protein YgdD (TMEM256/DUF423 family)|uniref:Uncharacterized membrane protein YgdD (TMEM256/DUF423 family) n=1 Tax=Myroides indicus TaxID=1323422 RepID=A0A4R7EP70_9FLAO|nr:DUF423 domain-containing protein [Myroides indicus]TDS52973.1 uncharacterized membrane protein YgdD (TMEM256/DUF423 family) [Myroides indicus]